MQQNLKKHLSKAEMDRLAMFLTSPEAVDALDLIETHGLLTAVVSAPGMVMPSLWQPLIIGKTEFRDDKQAQSVFGLILRLFNQIITELTDKKKFLPLGYPDPDSLQRWCRGYLAGARLDEDWRSDEYGLSSLLPFGVLAGEFSLVGQEDRNGGIIEDQSEHEKFYRKQLPDWVQELHDHYLKERRESTRPPNVQRQRKIGRNDPCPCGSGKKHKKCCGAAGSLH